MKTRTLKNEGRRKTKKGDNLTTIRGIVIAAEWDEEGNPLATSISTPGEQDYLVEPDSKGKELLGLVRQEIEVVGVVNEREKGRNKVVVRTYRSRGIGN